MINLTTERLRTLLVDIISCITRHTHDPEITLDDHRFILRVDPRDQGRCVGKQGNTIWAIQAVFWYAGYTQALGPWTIKLLEPKAPYKGLASPFKFTPKWDREKIHKMLASLSDVCLPSHSSYEVTEQSKTVATVKFQIEPYLRTAMSDPPIMDALTILVRAGGMAQGVSLTTEMKFA